MIGIYVYKHEGDGKKWTWYVFVCYLGNEMSSF
jgi:hypothetical protein